MTDASDAIVVSDASVRGGSDTDPTFWHQLIDEQTAADFLDITRRTVQSLRQSGRGPHFIRISSRCVKYRRRDLKEWVDKHLRTSTADPGPNGTD